jgi:hypothetical protein
MKKTATSLFLLLFGATTFAQIPTDNLLCHLKFANDLTDETATATSSIVGNAAAIGYTTDRFGNPNHALNIDNVFNGYVDLGDLNLVDPDYTISLWMKFSTFTGSQRKVISKRAACTGGSLFDMTLYSGPHTLVLESYAQGSAVANISDGTVLTPDSWIHVVFVVDQVNEQTKYFINGSLLGTVDWTSALPDGTMDNSAGIALGYSPCVNDAGVQRFHGSFDDLRIYTRSLTGAEVTELYNEENPTAGLNDEMTMNILVSPNPASNLLKINTATPTSAMITSANGTIMSNLELNGQAQVDVSTYAPGVYFIRTAEGQTVKFIKE